MDFDDTPTEAAFRAEVRSFLEAHAQLKTGTDSDSSRGAVATDPAEQDEYQALCRSWHAPMWLAHTLAAHAEVVAGVDAVAAGAMRDEALSIARTTGQHRLASSLTTAVAAHTPGR